ncbi:high-affinity nickel-transport protein-domain-containing protein [Naematelia encephala]|uniref:Nickel/cobalt efflux system n=1 Tax=Naematelia encephala TaxID=71784 RepID=A0A1Y2AJL2_9TREE|nr:high-affinity nickel-transport protein-domain-containing protein [Naematelia encephala]
MRITRFAELRHRRLTLLGRALALVSAELLANAIVWTIAGIFLSQADGLMGLALLAWTIGLRHGLDADHISAIDNATRQLVSLGQLPITCGLFFSLGHSTIVIVVNIALAISINIYDKLDRVGSVGGIVGTSISSTFLFLIAVINTYFLISTIRERRRTDRLRARGLPIDEAEQVGKIHGGGCLVRIIAPVLRAVNKPWKMYPVGVLFGFGFDTASSIALLGISAVATRGPDGETINHGKIVILPFLFTAGMTLVDSLDSVLMLYAYAAPALGTQQRRLAVFEDRKTPLPVTLPDLETPPVTVELLNSNPPTAEIEEDDVVKPTDDATKPTGLDQEQEPGQHLPEDTSTSNRQRVLNGKANTMSTLSIILTLLSILVALSISLIQIMGLIGDNCSSCTKAAQDPNGGGLAGSWWRAWGRANDQSGYIGAAIVGAFLGIVVGYYGGRWCWGKWRHRKGPSGMLHSE